MQSLYMKFDDVNKFVMLETVSEAKEASNNTSVASIKKRRVLKYLRRCMLVNLLTM